MSDSIKREDAIEAVLLALDRGDILDIISSLPSAEPQGDLISREDAIEAVASADATDGTVKVFTGRQVNGILSALPSAETHDKRTETHGVCLDIIRREDAIAYIDRVTNSGLGRKKSLEYIRKYIVSLPSADAVHIETYRELYEKYVELKHASADAEWIPCSERLPKRDELVLVTYKTTDRIHLCRYIDDGSENPWWSYIDDCCAWNNVVLAWMPLPKPYREEGKI